MRAVTLISLGLLCAGAAAPAWADDTQAWGTVSVQAKLSDAWRVSNETVLRTSDAKGFYEVEESVMLGYKPNKKITLWLGYTLDPNFSHGSLTTTEHRFRQQIGLDDLGTLGPVKVTGRLRLEERWRDGLAGTGWRVRPQVRFALPVHGKTSLNFAHESFVNLNSTAFQKDSGYERMRNALYLSTPLSTKLTFEVGYLEQHGFVRRGPDTDDHVLTVALAASF